MLNRFKTICFVGYPVHGFHLVVLCNIIGLPPPPPPPPPPFHPRVLLSHCSLGY